MIKFSLDEGQIFDFLEKLEDNIGESSDDIVERTNTPLVGLY